MLRPVHFDIQADDPARAANFYSAVFGWDIQKWDNPNMEYWMVMTAPRGDTSTPGISGGLLKRQGPPPLDGAGVNAFVCTVDIPSIDDSVAKIETAGGKVAVPKYALPGMAWLAYCKDTEGNLFGIYQEDKNAT